LRKLVFALAGLALIASGGFAAVAQGADHRDGPLSQANPTGDITDVYAFRSPADNNNLVVAINVNPLIVPTDYVSRGSFDPGVQYQLHVNKSSGLADDVTVNMRVTSSPYNLIVEGLGAPIVAPITPPTASAPIVTNAPGGIKVFAGERDDPFFFDLNAFNDLTSKPCVPVNGIRCAGAGAPADTFAGTNVLSIVLELPITAVTGAANSNSGTIKAWVSTTKASGGRLDRMAIPAINTALITADKKDSFNQGIPANDVANFNATAVGHINDLRKAVDGVLGVAQPQDGGPLGALTADQVAGALIPDVVTIDFSKPVQFPNGRRLQDDVIDVELGVVLNRVARGASPMALTPTTSPSARPSPTRPTQRPRPLQLQLVVLPVVLLPPVASRALAVEQRSYRRTPVTVALCRTAPRCGPFRRASSWSPCSSVVPVWSPRCGDAARRKANLNERWLSRE